MNDVSKLVETYRDRALISKQSSREMIGLDHSKEEEFIEDEGGEDKILGRGLDQDVDGDPKKKGQGLK